MAAAPPVAVGQALLGDGNYRTVDGTRKLALDLQFSAEAMENNTPQLGPATSALHSETVLPPEISEVYEQHTGAFFDGPFDMPTLVDQLSEGGNFAKALTVIADTLFEPTTMYRDPRSSFYGTLDDFDNDDNPRGRGPDVAGVLAMWNPALRTVLDTTKEDPLMAALARPQVGPAGDGTAAQPYRYNEGIFFMYDLDSYHGDFMTGFFGFLASDDNLDVSKSSSASLEANYRRLFKFEPLPAGFRRSPDDVDDDAYRRRLIILGPRNVKHKISEVATGLMLLMQHKRQTYAQMGPLQNVLASTSLAMITAYEILDPLKRQLQLADNFEESRAGRKVVTEEDPDGGMMDFYDDDLPAGYNPRRELLQLVRGEIELFDKDSPFRNNYLEDDASGTFGGEEDKEYIRIDQATDPNEGGVPGRDVDRLVFMLRYYNGDRWQAAWPFKTLNAGRPADDNDEVRAEMARQFVTPGAAFVGGLYFSVPERQSGVSWGDVYPMGIADAFMADTISQQRRLELATRELVAPFNSAVRIASGGPQIVQSVDQRPARLTGSRRWFASFMYPALTGDDERHDSVRGATVDLDASDFYGYPVMSFQQQTPQLEIAVPEWPLSVWCVEGHTTESGPALGRRGALVAGRQQRIVVASEVLNIFPVGMCARCKLTSKLTSENAADSNAAAGSSSGGDNKQRPLLLLGLDTDRVPDECRWSVPQTRLADPWLSIRDRGSFSLAWHWSNVLRVLSNVPDFDMRGIPHDFPLEARALAVAALWKVWQAPGTLDIESIRLEVADNRPEMTQHKRTLGFVLGALNRVEQFAAHLPQVLEVMQSVANALVRETRRITTITGDTAGAPATMHTITDAESLMTWMAHRRDTDHSRFHGQTKMCRYVGTHSAKFSSPNFCRMVLQDLYSARRVDTETGERFRQDVGLYGVTQNMSVVSDDNGVTAELRRQILQMVNTEAVVLARTYTNYSKARIEAIGGRAPGLNNLQEAEIMAYNRRLLDLVKKFNTLLAQTDPMSYAPPALPDLDQGIWDTKDTDNSVNTDATRDSLLMYR